MRFFFNPLSGQVNAGPPREIVYADTAPQYPLEGSRWFDTINLREYVYDGAAWVETGVGPAGVKGDTGEKGDKGDIGNVGPVGPQGPAATIAVGTVTTGAAGTSASVSNSGNSGAAVFDFTIPQGAKGDTGNIGPQGPQGIQGVKGDDGASISLKGAVTSPADLTSIAVKVEGDLYVAQSDGNGYVWDGSAWVDVGQIRGPKGDTGAQGPAGPAPAGTGAVVVSNGVVGTPVGYGTANVANTLVQRDASGNFSAGTITGTFSGNVTGGVTGNVTGNASTASKLATAQTINVSGDVTGTAQSFDGSAAITIPTAISAGVIVNADINAAAAISDTKLATISTAGKVSNSATTATSANTNSAIVARDTNGNFSATTITAALSGNATTASSAAKLTTARNINGVSFDGSADISINNFGYATASYLTVSPQDAVNEGGEIALRGAGSFSDFRIDNFQGNARIHTLAAGKRLEILGGSIYANGTADNFFQGSVGIGTTTPGGKLHVHGGPNDDSTADLYVTGSGGWTAVHNNSSAGAWNPLVNAGDKSVIFSGGTAGTGNLVVAPWSGSSNGVKINQDGVVLIGTSSPSNSGWSSQKIEAFGGSVMSRTDTSEGGRLELLNLTKTGTDVSNWSLYNMTGAYQKGLHFWRYQANGGNPGTSMFLSDGGNVGIGTTTPEAKLHVNGAIMAQTAGGAKAYIGGDGSNDIEIGSTSAGTTMVHLWNPAAGRFMDLTAGSITGSLNASNLTGTIANAQLPARLQAAAQTITDWNNALENGWYQGASAANAPEGVLDWWLGYVEAHYDRWVTQTVHRFTIDAPANTQIWRRSCADAGADVRTWGPWYKLQLSQAEQDARYAPVNHSHPGQSGMLGSLGLVNVRYDNGTGTKDQNGILFSSLPSGLQKITLAIEVWRHGTTAGRGIIQIKTTTGWVTSNYRCCVNNSVYNSYGFLITGTGNSNVAHTGIFNFYVALAPYDQATKKRLIYESTIHQGVTTVTQLKGSGYIEYTGEITDIVLISEPSTTSTVTDGLARLWYYT